MSMRLLCNTLIALSCSCSVSLAAPQIPATEPQSIRELQAKKRTDANAAWWGFNAEDSTECLQAAIDSGAAKLIIPHLGRDWIVSRPLKLASDQEIIFEKGVVLLAKAGAFKKTSECLLVAEGRKNITLSGYGATLKMRKADYQDAAQYKKSEWRHGLSLLSSSNVKVLGLRIVETGGDGIYLGRSHAVGDAPNTDIVIRDVVCDANHRQGISVITAKNLLIENCALNNTSGTAPQAGIDFEPNMPQELLENCTMRNCVLEGNKGDGLLMSVHLLTAASKPISLHFENCTIRGNSRNGIHFSTHVGDGGSVTGDVTFKDCAVAGSGGAGLLIRNNPAENGCRFKLSHCSIQTSPPVASNLSPITISASKTGSSRIGNLELQDCTISDRAYRPFLSFRDDAADKSLSSLRGSVTVSSPLPKWELGPRTEAIDLKVTEKELPFEPLRLMPITSASAGGSAQPASSLRVRGAFAFVLWGEEGKPLNLDLIGSPRDAGLTTQLLSPAGKVIAELKVPSAGGVVHHESIAPATGVYMIRGYSKLWAQLRTAPPWSILAIDRKIHLFGPRGQLDLWPSSGATSISVRVAGSGDEERVTATLLAPGGAAVAKALNASGREPAVLKCTSSGPINAPYRLILEPPTVGTLEDVEIELTEGLADTVGNGGVMLVPEPHRSPRE